MDIFRFHLFPLGRLVLVAGLLIAPAQAQWDSTSVLKRARQDIAVLCSDSLAGRGYVDAGHRKAARVIGRRFAGIGLRPVPKAGLPDASPGVRAAAGPHHAPAEYWQRFQLKLNRITRAELQIEGTEFEAGTDFIPGRQTAALKGRYDLVYAGHGTMEEIAALGRQGFQEAVLVIEGGRLPAAVADSLGLRDSVRRLFGRDPVKIELARQLGAAGVILLKDKLTHAYAKEQVPLGVLHLKREAFRRAWRSRGHRLKLRVEAAVASIETQNVLGYVPGREPDSPAVIFCAHYDHLGRIGPAVFAGANDNASGVALLLSLARHYAQLPPAERPAHPLVFIAFGGEESGLDGSRYYAGEAPRVPLSETALVLDFDLWGYGEEGATVVAAPDFPHRFRALKAARETAGRSFPLKPRKNTPNSDHYPFTKRGVPAFFFYALGGKPYYHDVYDRPEELSLAGFWPFRQILITYLQGPLQLPE